MSAFLDETGLATFSGLIKSAIATVQTDTNTRAKIATGSYTGTGTYGISNPCSLTFDFVPKIVLVGDGSSVFIAIAGANFALGNPYNSSGNYLQWTTYSLSWYCSQNETNQNNCNGQIYHYVALG